MCATTSRSRTDASTSRHPINEELHNRNTELSRSNSDLLNLLSSVQIAIVMVSS
jgi:hypothetical protein